MKLSCQETSAVWRNIVEQLHILRGLSLAIVFLCVSAAYAERLPVKTYTVANGLLRDGIHRIKQDSRGFLWFCTLEGVSRFDGYSFTNFTTEDGLPDRTVADFFETKNGVIYLATNKGLARLNPDGMRGSAENPLFSVFLPDNKRAEKIQTLYEDRNNQVWVGTSDGLYKLIEADGRIAFESVALGEPLPGFGGALSEPDPNAVSVTSILETKNGVLWVGTFGSGLFRLSENGGVRRVAASDGLGDNKITDLLEDRSGNLWVSKRSDVSGGVCRLNAEASEQSVRKCYSMKDGLGSNWVRDIFETSDGGLWLATVPGLCRFQPEGETPVCKTYSVENNLCGDIFALAEDKDGNLWTGSSCGAKKIARYGFITYGAADGLDSDHINSIFENSTGEFFAITFPRNKRFISRFDGNKFTTVEPRLPVFADYHYGWGWQQTVWQDSRGAWWIPTGQGLFRSPDNTNFENLASVPLEKQKTGAKGEEVFRIFEDSRGDVWIVTTGFTNELLRWERAKKIWHDHTLQAGFSATRAGSALVEDKHGNVWIGASSDHGDSALIRYRPSGEFRVLTEREGAPSDWIRDLFLDSRGRLWIASTGDGAWRLDETNSDAFEFVKYAPENGLTSIATACVTEDQFGRIYIGTWRGIDRLTPDTGQIENFTTADGLPASFVENAYRDRNNNLWFAGENGLARFIPEPPRVRKPPNILITGFRVNGISQAVSVLGEVAIPALDLGSDQRQITVEFLGLGATLGEKLRYEYRLNDSDWTPTGERTLNFANLGNGENRLEIRAETADRIYSA
jgi:ligand-binding sensor domain-containing protein